MHPDKREAMLDMRRRALAEEMAPTEYLRVRKMEPYARWMHRCKERYEWERFRRVWRVMKEDSAMPRFVEFQNAL